MLGTRLSVKDLKLGMPTRVCTAGREQLKSPRIHGVLLCGRAWMVLRKRFQIVFLRVCCATRLFQGYWLTPRTSIGLEARCNLQCKIRPSATDFQEIWCAWQTRFATRRSRPEAFPRVLAVSPQECIACQCCVLHSLFSSVFHWAMPRPPFVDAISAESLVFGRW